MRHWYILSAVYVGILTGMASADDPPKPKPLPIAAFTIQPASPVEPGVPVTIDASSSTADDVQVVSFIDDSVLKAGPSDQVKYLFTIEPGTYFLYVDAASMIDGKIKRSTKPITVVIQASKPKPKPVPPDDPTPPTPPSPPPVSAVTGHLHVTLFFDINDPSVAAFRSSPTLGAELAKLDCSWYALATTAPAAQPFAGELAGDGTPVVLVQDATNRLLRDAGGKTLAIKSPKSPADLLAKIQAIRGGK